MITAKVVYATIPPVRAKVTLPSHLSGKVVYDHDSMYEKAVVPFLDHAINEAIPGAVVTMEDVDVVNSAMATGAILFWEETYEKFLIEKFNPAKISSQVINGGTF